MTDMMTPYISAAHPAVVYLIHYEEMTDTMTPYISAAHPAVVYLIHYEVVRNYIPHTHEISTPGTPCPRNHLPSKPFAFIRNFTKSGVIPKVKVEPLPF